MEKPFFFFENRHIVNMAVIEQNQAKADPELGCGVFVSSPVETSSNTEK